MTKALPKSPHVEIFGARFSWYIRLVAANGEKLAVSEAYRTRWNATRAAKRSFKGMPIEYV